MLWASSRVASTRVMSDSCMATSLCAGFCGDGRLEDFKGPTQDEDVRPVSRHPGRHRGGKSVGDGLITHEDRWFPTALHVLRGNYNG